jgi:hypothetical protein
MAYGRFDYVIQETIYVTFREANSLEQIRPIDRVHRLKLSGIKKDCDGSYDLFIKATNKN